MIGFKKINKLNHNESDDIYLITKTRRRKYDYFDLNDEERDAMWDHEKGEPKLKEYETRYQMQSVSDMSLNRLNRALKKDHLLMRFTDEED